MSHPARHVRAGGEHYMTKNDHLMKPRYNRLLLLVALFFLPVFKTNAVPSLNTVHQELWSLENEFFIQEQFRLLQLPFSSGYDQEVGRLIMRYLYTGKQQTELILERAEYYFPIFEEYLREYELPTVMKYLPIVESGLRATVESRVGAVGLWQFMPVTARHFRLEISDEIDDRRDPRRSSEAAVRFLSLLYRDFCDWALTLAAYNCGPGRVRRAIAKAGSTRYEDIEPFLPSQTRRYIKKFKAAAFVVNYYQFFGLNPRNHSHTSRKVELIRITEELSFGEIAEVSGTNLSVIRELNPAYLQEVIPARRQGRVVVLPRKGAHQLMRHFDGEDWLEIVGPEKNKNHQELVKQAAEVENSPTAAAPAGAIPVWKKEWLAGLILDYDHNPKKPLPLLVEGASAHANFHFPPQPRVPAPGLDDPFLAAVWAQRQILRIQTG